jgi:4-hydroxybenzoate polyprenyltransferase
VINDLWDRKLDAQVDRTKLRPLASGAITTENALIFLSMLLMIGLIILLLLEPTAIMLGILVLPLIVLYPFTKRLTYWPQAVLGITFNFGALMGWAAMDDSVGLAAFFLYIGGVFWTLGYDTVYAHQDKEDDVLIGVKSTALLFAGESKIFVTGFYCTALFGIFMAMVFAGVSLFAYIGLIAAVLHLGWQITRWVPDNPESSLKVFKSNRDFGLIVLATILVGAILV